MAKLEVIKLDAESAQAQQIRLDRKVEESIARLKMLGAKSTEAVMVVDGKPISALREDD